MKFSKYISFVHLVFFWFLFYEQWVIILQNWVYRVEVRDESICRNDVLFLGIFRIICIL